MKRLLIFILPSILIITSVDTLVFAQKETPPHLALAHTYVGVTEKTGKNDGKEVEMFLRYVGLSKGNPYCAAFVSYCIGRSNVHEPMIISASARQFVTAKSIKAYYVLTGKYTVPPGSICIWQRGNGWQGHVGFTTRQLSSSTFRTIEANTSSGDRGSQYDGGGVWERTRQIVLTNHFRIIAFTLVRYV